MRSFLAGCTAMSTKKGPKGSKKGTNSAEDSWANHAKMYEKASAPMKKSKKAKELERQAQYGAGVVLAAVSVYFILMGGDEIHQLKPTTVNTAFASGDPWLVLCDKSEVKDAIKKSSAHKNFAEAADLLTDEGVMSGVLNCNTKSFSQKKGKSVGETWFKRFNLDKNVGVPVMFALWNKKGCKTRKGCTRKAQVPSASLVSAEAIAEFVKSKIPTREEILAAKHPEKKKKKDGYHSKPVEEEEEFVPDNDHGIAPTSKEERRRDRARRKEAARKERLAKEASKSGVSTEDLERKDREKRAREKMEEEQRAQIPQAVDPADIREEVEDEDEGEVIDLDEEE